LLTNQQAGFRAAADELLALRKDEPANRQSLFLLADCYVRLGQNKDVVALLDPVYQKDPNDQAFQYALGTALIRTGNLSRGE